jgi:YidC/Oxa1 family membrane protein insertase
MEPKSNFDPRTILVILVCMGVWFGWQRYLENKYPETMNPAATTTTNGKPEALANLKEKPLNQPALHAKAEVETSVTGPEKTWDYEDSNWKVTVSSYGGRVSEIILKNYTDRAGRPIKLVSLKEPGYLMTDVKGVSGVSFSKANFQVKPISKEAVQLTATQHGLTINKTLTMVPEKYIIKDETLIDGKDDTIQSVTLAVSQPAPLESQAQSGATSFFNRGAGGEIQEYYFNHGSKSNRHLVTYKDPIEKTYEQTHFASLGSRYFTTLLFNRGNVLPTGEAVHRDAYSYLELNYPVLEKSGPVALNLDLYAGPKLLNQLKQVDESAAQVVDFGFFSWIALPLLELMKYFYKIFNNYGVAIIALTILVRGITFPFTYVSYKSMKAMQRIQPEIKRIKEIYKDNTQAINQETMKLMKENKVNPAGGCLPLLFQLPIFWALYQVLQNSIELYHSPFLGWIHDLSMKDPFYILPALMCLSMVLQQRITPSTMDPAQAKVMMFMPIFFGFLMMSLPAGLTLYIFVSTLFGIVQQLYMMKDRGPTAQPALVRKA